MIEQTSLFSCEQQTIDLEDGSLVYYPNWIDQATSDRLFVQLQEQIEWQQSTINVYGKKIKIPRLNAWYGDKNCSYRYSGTLFEPLTWLPCLLEIKQKIECETGDEFNSVLVNYYRDGNDSVSWHSDDEPELGLNPIVASVSLGEERIFQLRHRFKKELETHKIALVNGSLLLMSGELQHQWKHQIPKSKKILSERINLTFRKVYPNLTKADNH